MGLFRVILYTGVILGVVSTWEFVRDDVKKAVDHVVHVVDTKETSAKSTSLKTTDLSKEKPESEKAENKTEPLNQQKAEEKEEIPEEAHKHISFEKGFADIAKGAMNSVVNVSTIQLLENDDRPDFQVEIFKGTPFDDVLKDFFGSGQQQQPKSKKINALGSGFIVKVSDCKAYIVTNYHVVEKAKKIIVFLSDKTELPAEVHATDQRADIAILSIEKNVLANHIEKLKPITWGDSDKVTEGNWVLAIGNPFGFGSTVTNGIVSAKGRDIRNGVGSVSSFVDDFIQHSAPINLGSSGGCLLDVYGNVIGINNAICSMSGGNIGIGFAIPSNIAKVAVEQLIKHKRTFRGWLGAEVQLVTAKQAESVGLTKRTTDSSKVFGVFVAKVIPDSPAEKAGIKQGDILLEFNGKKITEKNSLQKIVGNSKIDSSVKAKIWRQKDGETWGEIIVDVNVGDFEKMMESGALDTKNEKSKDSNKKNHEEFIDALGITISSVPEKRKLFYPAEVNVIVTKVEEPKELSFYDSIFMPGDGLVKFNNKKITSTAHFKKVLEEAKEEAKNDKNKLFSFVIIRDRAMLIQATTINFDDPSEQKKIEHEKEAQIIEKNKIKEGPKKKPQAKDEDVKAEQKKETVKNDGSVKKKIVEKSDVVKKEESKNSAPKPEEDPEN